MIAWLIRCWSSGCQVLLKWLTGTDQVDDQELNDQQSRKCKGGNQKERWIQPVISPLSVLHSPEHTKRFTELGREEEGEGGDRGNLVESPKGERAIQPVILLPSKNGY